MSWSLLGRLVRGAVLRALSRWSLGQLELQLPDGELRHFGPPHGRRARLFVRDDALFARFALQGDLGAGESYSAGEWSTDDLPGLLALCLENRERLALDTPLTRLLNLGNDLLHALRRNTRAGARRNIAAHYDLSNEFFALFLDETMTYSSAVFAGRAQSLAAAQRNKYRLMAEKARLGPDDHLLELGCGWGGFALYAAREYGCRVTGLTISARQHALASERVRAAGLEGRVLIRLQDWRDVQGRFDKIVSIEMFEALGFENWAAFFARLDALLADDGLVALQAISIPDRRFEEYRRHCDWLQKHVFPGSLLAAVGPLSRELARASRLALVALDDVGVHYAETLRRWRLALLRALPQVRALGFDDSFARTWEYYLAVCEAAFATRTLGNLQLVLARPGAHALLGPSEPAAAGRQVA